MALNKIRKLDQDSYGVTLPIDDLRVAGLVDENGELVEDAVAHIQMEDEGKWSVEQFDGFEQN